MKKKKKSLNNLDKKRKNKQLNAHLSFIWRIKLLFFRFKWILLVLLILAVIILSISLWLTLGFFKKHYYKTLFNTSFVQTQIIQDYNSAKDLNFSKLNNNLKNHFLDYLGHSELSTSTDPDGDYFPFHEGTIFFLGSSATKDSRKMVDIPYSDWGRVSKYGELYKYYKNGGPLNNYIKDIQNDNYDFSKNNIQDSSFIKKWWLGNPYYYKKLLSDTTYTKSQYYKPYLGTLSSIFAYNHKSDLQKNSVIGYENNQYSLNDSFGSNKNPKLDIYNIIQILLNTNQVYNNNGNISDYNNNPYVEHLTINGDWQKYKYDENYPNKYFDHISDSFSVSTIPIDKNSISEDIKFPLIGVIHKAYYYKKGDIKTKYPAYKLFYELGPLNAEQFNDFVNYIYLGEPHNNQSLYTSPPDKYNELWDDLRT